MTHQVRRMLMLTYIALQASHPQVQRDGDSLPTFSEFKAVTLENKSRTVQDVWGLILTSLPGEFDILHIAATK